MTLMAIETRILPSDFSIGISPENGNAQLIAMDREANTIIVIELTKDAWEGLLRNGPRLRGVGIPHVRTPGLVLPASGDNGNGT